MAIGAAKSGSGVVLLAAHHDANPVSWEAILLWFSLYFSFPFIPETKCLGGAAQTKATAENLPLTFQTAPPAKCLAA